MPGRALGEGEEERERGGRSGVEHCCPVFAPISV